MPEYVSRHRPGGAGGRVGVTVLITGSFTGRSSSARGLRAAAPGGQSPGPSDNSWRPLPEQRLLQIAVQDISQLTYVRGINMELLS